MENEPIFLDLDNGLTEHMESAHKATLFVRKSFSDGHYHAILYDYCSECFDARDVQHTGKLLFNTKGAKELADKAFKTLDGESEIELEEEIAVHFYIEATANHIMCRDLKHANLYFDEASHYTFNKAVWLPHVRTTQKRVYDGVPLAAYSEKYIKKTTRRQFLADYTAFARLGVKVFEGTRYA